MLHLPSGFQAHWSQARLKSERYICVPRFKDLYAERFINLEDLLIETAKRLPPHPLGFRHLPLEAESVEPSWNPAGVQLKSSRRRSMTTSEDCWRKKGLLEGLLRGTTWPKTCENIAKIVPRPSKIEPWGLQNRAWSPPRRHFYKTLNLRRFKWADATIF